MLLWYVVDGLVVWKVCERGGLRKGILMEGVKLFYALQLEYFGHNSFLVGNLMMIFGVLESL